MANESMSGFDERKMPHIREAIDAESHQGLKADPTDHDAKLQPSAKGESNHGLMH